MSQTPITVAFFGISGSGKGTQADLLEKFLRERDPARDVVRAEMGNLARAFMKSGTPLAEAANSIVSSGGLLPSFIPIHLLVKHFDEAKVVGDEHFIFDGTFRKPLQSEVGDEIAQFYGRAEKHAIMLDLRKDAARTRLLARGRADDATIEALDRRFEWFEKDVIPSFHRLGELGWKMHEVNGEGTIEGIHGEVLTNLALK